MMNLMEAACACGGRVFGSGLGNPRFSGVSTDSRNIAKGELLIALRGTTFDGHDFVRQVIESGAVAAMVDEAWLATQSPDLALPLVVVADTRLALGTLAAVWRRRFSIPLIGLTGSNGKTTVKEMCAAILHEQARRDGFDPTTAVLATTGNLNNDIGLPLMLLRLRATHRAAVIEMGMNHPGEIDYLTRITAPTVALVNNAQRAHLEGLGTLTGVARAKGEIFNGLPHEGTAVINADDEHSAVWRELADAASIHRVIGFGIEQAAEVSAICQPISFGSYLKVTTPQGAFNIELKVPGLHNARNALAAVAATLAAGASLAAVGAGLSGYAGIKGRLQRRQAESGALLIDDTYNANPDSMRAAIDVLAALPGRKVFVIGDMGEVGVQTGQFHDEIGGYAKSMGIDRLLAIGEHSATAARNFGEGAQHFKNIAVLIEALRPLLDTNTTVLIKGSRFMRMERIADAIESKTD